MLKFKKDTKHGVDWWIRNTRDPESEVDSIDWEPRLAWQAIVDTTDDTRSFEEWSEQVEWAGIWSATDELDPSGARRPRPRSPRPHHRPRRMRMVRVPRLRRRAPTRHLARSRRSDRARRAGRHGGARRGLTVAGAPPVVHTGSPEFAALFQRARKAT